MNAFETLAIQTQLFLAVTNAWETPIQDGLRKSSALQMNMYDYTQTQNAIDSVFVANCQDYIKKM